MKHALLMLCIAAVTLKSGGCAGEKAFSEVAFYMDTAWEITIWGRDAAKSAFFIAEAFEKVRRYEKEFSCYEDAGEVTDLNTAGRAAISEDLASVIMLAQEIGAKTKGAFDISILPLMRVWRWDEGGRIPSEYEVAQALKLVDYRNIRVRGKQAELLKHGMAVDAGGIAKGYAIDMVWKHLKGRGVKRGLINAGGDMRVLGIPHGRLWRIAVKHPADNDAYLGVVEIAHGAVATSGDYERFFIEDGVRYHHILDPRTGYPATKVRSVTVYAHNAASADAWATALFVLGPDEGIARIEEEETVEALFFDGRGELRMSEGFKRIWKETP